MSTNKQALREAAQKATPGKWWIDSHGSAMVSFSDDKEVLPVFITDGDSMGPAVRHEDTGNLSHWRNDNDATFIAAANPATVLALLDELEAKDRMVADLLNIISRHTVELGWGEKPITMAELIISREGSGSDVLDAIRAAAAGKGE